uniref:Uncharacterized protein n=1 Tax=Rhizophora mucronata TaxID=61149 RepID=A0A2P2M2N5_RHIMU
MSPHIAPLSFSDLVLCRNAIPCSFLFRPFCMIFYLQFVEFCLHFDWLCIGSTGKVVICKLMFSSTLFLTN